MFYLAQAMHEPVLIKGMVVVEVVMYGFPWNLHEVLILFYKKRPYKGKYESAYVLPLR